MPCGQDTAAPTGTKYCLGLQGQACVFGANGKRARPNGPRLCLFCDTEKLNDAFLQPGTSVFLRKRYARLTAAAQEIALQRVERRGFRQWLRETGTAAPMAESAVVPQKRKMLASSQPETTKLETAEEAWAEVLQQRTASAFFFCNKPNIHDRK